MYNNIIEGFDIATPTDSYEGLLKYRKQGALKGVYLGFPNIHEHYTMALPGVTDWTGFPMSGKTQILLEFLVNTSVFYGWKHLLYVPDLGDRNEALADIIHKVSGMTFEERKHQISESEISKQLPWVCEHFKILYKKDGRKKITPYQFWDLAVKMKKESGLHTATIDSWKDMSKKHDFGRDDLYLEDVLEYRNFLAEKNKMHFHTIIHPKLTEKDGSGNRKPPTLYDLKGGSEWANSGKSNISVHRPVGEGNKVEVYFNKIKPRSIGKTGYTELYFDTKSFRYYLKDGDKERFASKEVYKVSSQKEIFGDDGDNDLPF